MKPDDTLHFFAEHPTLGFVETASRRWEINPEIPLVKNREYKVEIYPNNRFVLSENLDDGWKVVVDALSDDH